MASFNLARDKVKINEGGYSPGFNGSGETYKGIDRKYGAPHWPGWKILDRISNKKEHDVFRNPTLELLVEDFYLNKMWRPSRAGEMKDQALATMYYDFYFHKPAVAIAAANLAALQINPSAVSNNNRLTDDVIRAINNSPEDVYRTVYNLRIQHYQNKWMNKIGKTNIRYTTTQKGLLNRAMRFPAPAATATQFVDAFSPGSWLKRSRDGFNAYDHLMKNRKNFSE